MSKKHRANRQSGKRRIQVVLSLYPCPACGNRDIGKEQCVAITSGFPKNKEFCIATSCASPWRLCVTCVLQGYKEEDAVVKHADGTCVFHRENGVEAKRQKVESGYDGRHELPSVARLKGDIILTIPVAKIRPFVGQPREYFNQARLKALAAGIKDVGQLQPGAVRRVSDDPHHDFELVDGQRRWHACDMNGMPFRAFVRNVTGTEHQFELSAAFNFGHDEHTPLEFARAARRIMENRRRSVKEIAKLFCCTEVTVYQHLKLLKLVQAVQDMMSPELPEKKRLTSGSAVYIAKLPPEKQLALAQRAINENMATSQVRREVRKEAKALGIKVERERTPRDDYRNFTAYFRRVLRDGALFFDMTPDEFHEMFRFRQRRDITATAGLAADAFGLLERIKNRMEGELGQNLQDRNPPESPEHTELVEIQDITSIPIQVVERSLASEDS